MAINHKTYPRPLRVLHLIGELGGGGSERWLYDIVRLSPPGRIKHQVVTVYPEYAGDFIYASPLASKNAYQGSPAGPNVNLLRKGVRRVREQRHRVPFGQALLLPLRLGAMVAAAGRIIKACARFRPDVIHSHTLPDFMPGVLAKVVFGKPMIHTVPCLFAQMKDAGYGWMPRAYRLLCPWVELFSTGNGRSELLDIGIPAPKIMYDLCGVDLEAVRAAQAERARYRADIRRALGLPEDTLIALSTGRLHSSKGHLFALDALRDLLGKFPTLHLVILGEGGERGALEARAGQSGVEAHAHLLGFRDDPLPFYAAADIYLRTALFEPENLSFYQAMAMGVPVIAFETGWESDPVRKVGNGILVPGGDSAALAAAMAQVLTEPDRGRAIGARGVGYSQEHLDLRRSIAALSSTYEALHERSRRSRRDGVEALMIL